MLAAAVVYAIGARIAMPTIDGGVLVEFLRQGGGGGLLRVYDWFVGGALSRGALLAIGIMPYISAKIMMRLARPSSPTRWTRRLTFGLALVQSYGFARFLETVPGAVLHPGPMFIAQTMAVLTTGAMCVAWLSEDLLAPHETPFHVPTRGSNDAIGAGPLWVDPRRGDAGARADAPELRGSVDARRRAGH